jgi:hypothetical protein
MQPCEAILCHRIRYFLILVFISENGERQEEPKGG